MSMHVTSGLLYHEVESYTKLIMVVTLNQLSKFSQKIINERSGWEIMTIASEIRVKT